MTDVSIPVDRRLMPERRVLRERRTLKNRRMSMESKKAEQQSQSMELSPLLRLVCIILLATIGLVVYEVTGLCEGVNSTIGHIVVGGGIICYFIMMFGHGVSLKRF